LSISQFCLGCIKVPLLEVTHFADFVFLEFAGERIGEFQIHLGYVVATVLDCPLCSVDLKLDEVDVLLLLFLLVRLMPLLQLVMKLLPRGWVATRESLIWRDIWLGRLLRLLNVSDLQPANLANAQSKSISKYDHQLPRGGTPMCATCQLGGLLPRGAV
jgi:hypothetical protein